MARQSFDADTLYRIRPLREELASLEQQYENALVESEEVVEQVKALEERIAQMKQVCGLCGVEV